MRGWDADGFCRRCQRHLDDGCECSGAAAERGRRAGQGGGREDRRERRPAARAAADERVPPPDEPGHAELPPEPVTLPGIPAYPVAALAGPLADLASSTTLPPALVCGAGLGALAGLCGAADLVMPDGSPVRPVLWVPLVAPRGAGKSPSQDRAFGTLRTLDAAAHDEYRTLLSEHLALPAKDRAAAPMPADTTRRIDDATLETTARWLERGDGTGVVECDELSGWLQSIGQYKTTSGDKGRWLAMWSSAPWRYQRVGDNRSGGIGIDILIRRPVLSIVGGIQPHLHHLLGDADSGFRPRWLPHIAPLETVTWSSRVHPSAEWDAAIGKLYHARGRREWRLDGEALRVWQQSAAEWKRQARGAENPSTSAALDKSDIQSARIALVLAESMHPGKGGDAPVDAMRSAVAVTDYVMHSWRALPGHESFALSHRDEILSRKVDELANWLETRAEKRATRTQIKEAAVAGVRKSADIDALLNSYMAVYPGTVVAYQPAGRGRPGQMILAPVRGHRGAITISPTPPGGVSERSETPVGGEGSSQEVKPQVTGSHGVSEQVLGNSMLGNNLLGNSSSETAQTPLCQVCRQPLNPRLAEAGETRHPTC
jgi:hypothetical protein